MEFELYLCPKKANTGLGPFFASHQNYQKPEANSRLLDVVVSTSIFTRLTFLQLVSTVNAIFMLALRDTTLISDGA
jgi:hypothetical protein